MILIPKATDDVSPWNRLLSKVNQTQYFLPGLSWFFVFYTYMNIGEGKIWKYLMYVTSAGLGASICANFQDTFKFTLEYDLLLQIKWLEGIFWGINEFGFVYISYMKLSTVIRELQKKYWTIGLKLLFVYTIVVRFYLSYLNIAGRRNDAGSHVHGLTHVPLGIVEVIFMVLIVKTSIEQTKKSSMSKNVVATLLNSSLSRMFLVSLVFFSASILCFFFEPLYMKYLKNMAWRVKAILGLIFLLDLLLIRIELREQVTTNQNSNSISYPKPMNNHSTYIQNSNENINSTYNNNSGYMNSSSAVYNNSSSNLAKKYNNNIKYYNDSDDEDLNKFNLPSDPIIVKMTPPQSSPFENNNNDYSGSFNRPKMSDKYFNQLKQY